MNIMKCPICNNTDLVATGTLHLCLECSNQWHVCPECKTEMTKLVNIDKKKEKYYCPKCKMKIEV